ncbi:hypothetical protein LZK73_07360 [Neorhizobium galegae]|nr:hypothetical protein LZK73_07360 [Neorhizobium galegae]
MSNILPASPSPSALRMTAYSFLGAVLISATSSAPTPLYHLYQELFHLSPAMITLIFGSYSFALLAALLTVGGLSGLSRAPPADPAGTDLQCCGADRLHAG